MTLPARNLHMEGRGSRGEAALAVALAAALSAALELESRVGLGTHRSVSSFVACNSTLAGAGCVGATDNGRPGQRSQAQPYGPQD